MKWSQQLKLLKGFSYFIFMYTNMFLSVHMNTWYFWKPKEGARSFGSCVTLCRCWDQTFILYESSKCSYSLSHVSVPPNSNFHSQIVYYNTIQRHISEMFTRGKLTVKKILSSYFKEQKKPYIDWKFCTSSHSVVLNPSRGVLGSIGWHYTHQTKCIAVCLGPPLQ